LYITSKLCSRFNYFNCSFRGSGAIFPILNAPVKRVVCSNVLYQCQNTFQPLNMSISSLNLDHVNIYA